MFALISDTPGSGFPLSHCLCDIGYELGRNARMLATQSPARVAEQSKVSDMFKTVYVPLTFNKTILGWKNNHV